MVYEIVVPKLGVSVNEAKILEWLKHEGDAITTGECIFVVETEKTTVDVEATVSGKLVRIIHREGQTLPAGTVAALVAEPGETVSIADIESRIAQISAREHKGEATQIAREPASAEMKGPITRPEIVKASPAARKLMRDHHIDPTSIPGTGPGSTITLSDIQRAIQKKPQPPAAPLSIKSTSELTGTRLTIARRLTQSQNEAVHVTLMTEVDASRLIHLKQEHATDNPSPSITELLIPMVARALKLHPEVNAVFEENQIKIVNNINVAVAIDTPDGLKVPVIQDADKQTLRGIVTTLRGLISRAESGQLAISDMAGGTFTISNLGMFGVEGFTPILNPPQCAILGVGSINEKPIVAAGQVSIGKMMTLSLSFDHRVMDGVTAAKFLLTLKKTVSGTDV